MDGYVFWFLIVSLLVNGIAAAKFKEIAEMKGHDGSAYFWYTFLFGISGMLMVIALPYINNTDINHLPAANAAPTQTTSSIATAAPIASEKNPNKANTPIHAEIKAGEKICPKCGTAQKADRHVCWSCGQPFDN